MDELTKLFTPFVDKDHMQAWLSYFLGFVLPDSAGLTKFDESSPAEFVWEVYQAIMEGKPLDIMGLAGRGSGKTVGASVIGLLSILHDTRGFVHAGVTTEQANRAREYFDKYVQKMEILKPFLSGEKNRKKIIFNLPEGGASAEIISLKPARVQGPHQALVIIDEIGSIGLDSGIASDVLKAYRDSAGILVTSFKSKPGVKVRITSRHSQASIPEQEIANAAKTKLRIVKWSTISVMKKCPPERSGTELAPLYINVFKDHHYTPEQFHALPENSKDGYELAPDVMDKCHKCPLVSICQGRARFQTSESALLSSIDDVCSKVLSQPWDWVLSQLVSLKPSAEALVYHEFDPQIHQPGWNVMWERLTGIPADHAVTRAEFVDMCKKKRCTFLAGGDWGFTAPSTCVVAAIDSKDNIYVLQAYGATGKDDPEFIQDILDHVNPNYPIDAYIPDPENPSGLSLMRKASLPVVEVDKSAGSVRAGINTVKRFLKVPGKNKYTKLFFAPDLASTIPGVPGIMEELVLYEKAIDKATGKPADNENPRGGFDHFLDSLRYLLYWQYGKAQASVAWAGNLDNATQQDSILQQASKTGNFQVNDNRDEFNQDGTPKKPNDDDDSGPAGGLNFTWT
jgi:hypothetical protein